MAELTPQVVRTWLKTMEPNKLFHYKTTCDGKIDPALLGNLRVIYSRLKAERFVASAGTRAGYYYVVDPIKPILNVNGGGEDYVNFIFPRSHEWGNEAGFDFEDLIAVSPGDLIVIAGVSNSGKTTLVLNLLADNINFKGGCLLMGNEYCTADLTVSPRFRRRFKAIEWSPLVGEDGSLNFELLPIKERFGNYIKKDALNIIDWLAMPSNFFEIQTIHDEIKSHIGKGVAVAVLQKTREKNYGDGGEFSERLADVYLKQDFLKDDVSLLTIGKIKERKKGAGKVIGRTWAFETYDGVHLSNIREVVKCTACWGKGWVKWGNTSKPCEACGKTGFVDKGVKESPF